MHIFLVTGAFTLLCSVTSAQETVLRSHGHHHWGPQHSHPKSSNPIQKFHREADFSFVPGEGHYDRTAHIIEPRHTEGVAASFWGSRGAVNNWPSAPLTTSTTVYPTSSRTADSHVMSPSIVQVEEMDCAVDSTMLVTLTETIRSTIIVTASPEFSAVPVPSPTDVAIPLEVHPFQSLPPQEVPAHSKTPTPSENAAQLKIPHEFPHPPPPGWSPQFHAPSTLQPLCGSHNPLSIKSHILDIVTDEAHTPFDCYEKCNRHSKCNAYSFTPGNRGDSSPNHGLSPRTSSTGEDEEECSRCSLYSTSPVHRPNAPVANGRNPNSPNPESVQANAAHGAETIDSAQNLKSMVITHSPLSDDTQGESEYGQLHREQDLSHIWYDLVCGDPTFLGPVTSL